MWSAGIVLVFAMARRYFLLMAHAHPVSNSIDFDDDGMVRVNLTPGVKRYSKPRHVIWFVERTIRLIGVAIVARIVLVIAQHNSSSFAKSQVIPMVAVALACRHSIRAVWCVLVLAAWVADTSARR